MFSFDIFYSEQYIGRDPNIVLKPNDNLHWSKHYATIVCDNLEKYKPKCKVDPVTESNYESKYHKKDDILPSTSATTTGEIFIPYDYDFDNHDPCVDFNLVMQNSIHSSPEDTLQDNKISSRTSFTPKHSGSLNTFQCSDTPNLDYLKKFKPSNDSLSYIHVDKSVEKSVEKQVDNSSSIIPNGEKKCRHMCRQK